MAAPCPHRLCNIQINLPAGLILFWFIVPDPCFISLTEQGCANAHPKTLQHEISWTMHCRKRKLNRGLPFDGNYSGANMDNAICIHWDVSLFLQHYLDMHLQLIWYKQVFWIAIIKISLNKQVVRRKWIFSQLQMKVPPRLFTLAATIIFKGFRCQISTRERNEYNQIRMYIFLKINKQDSAVFLGTNQYKPKLQNKEIR